MLFLLCCTVFVEVFCACRSSGKSPAEQKAVKGAVMELPLPAVPDSISDPIGRADYVIYHFWDKMNFADTVMSLDTAFMEQNFVNYIQLYDYASEKGRSEGTGRLMTKAKVSEPAYRFLVGIAEHYLLDPNSPMRNEEYFLPFIHEIVGNTIFSSAERMRYEYKETQIVKNRPGTRAADFRYITREGKKGTLHSTEANRLLLIFYDPDCENCSRIIGELRQDGDLRNAVASGEMTVLAVYTEGNRKLWDKTKSDMPAEWIVAIDDSGITENEIYHLPAMPVLYLLDADKKVIRKDFLPGGNQGT